MCETNLMNALSSSRRNRTLPLICWEDALTRSKTITLPDNKPARKISHNSNSLFNEAQKFYLPKTPPRPPLIAPFRGEVTWQCCTSKEPPDPRSDLLIIWIMSNEHSTQETSSLLAAYPPVSQWKFDIYLTDLSADNGPHSHTLLDRTPEENPLCIRIPLLSLLPKGRSLEDLNGHSLKVSANGVWPFRFYLLNTVIKLGDETRNSECVEDCEVFTPTAESDHPLPEEEDSTKCFTPSARLSELDAFIQQSKSSKSNYVPVKTNTSTDIIVGAASLQAVPRDLTSPRSRAAGGTPKLPQHIVPSAQKSFQKLLQMKQKSRYDSMSKIEKDQIGIRVLSSTAVRD